MRPSMQSATRTSISVNPASARSLTRLIWPCLPDKIGFKPERRVRAVASGDLQHDAKRPQNASWCSPLDLQNIGCPGKTLICSAEHPTGREHLLRAEFGNKRACARQHHQAFL